MRPRTVPWCLESTSSTRWRPDRRFRVPESAWLTSSSVDSRRDSRACVAAGSDVTRALAILRGAGAHRLLVGDRDGAQEWHQRAQLGADLLDPERALLLSLRVEPLAPGGVLLNPALRVLARADFLEHLLHLGSCFGRDDARAARVVAVLGGVAHRVPHVVQAALVNQIDDELQLVEAFEVCDLGLIARLDERVEAGLDERAHAATQDGLFA